MPGLDNARNTFAKGVFITQTVLGAMYLLVYLMQTSNTKINKTKTEYNNVCDI